MLDRSRLNQDVSNVFAQNQVWLNLLLDGAHLGRGGAYRDQSIVRSQPMALSPAMRSLRTHIAVRPEEFRAADSLVARRYAWRGYRTAQLEEAETGGSLTNAAPLTLLTEDSKGLLGTLTVRRDSPSGLLAEQTYAPEVERLRSDGRRIGELVKLAVERGADWKATLDALVQAAYYVTRVLHTLTDVLIEVNPRHVRFYEKVFGFVVAAAERFCSRAGAPSVLMQLDLEQFGRRLQLSPV
jgi:hypothetical protein